jgi:ATP-dependent RNA helicase DOB1
MAVLRAAESSMRNEDEGESVAKFSTSNTPACNRDMRRLLKLVFLQQLAPALVFSFSKKDCEMHALSVSKLDLATAQEKS